MYVCVSELHLEQLILTFYSLCQITQHVWLCVYPVISYTLELKKKYVCTYVYVVVSPHGVRLGSV